jgi:hypothetical protein
MTTKTIVGRPWSFYIPDKSQLTTNSNPSRKRQRPNPAFPKSQVRPAIPSTGIPASG